MFKSLMKNAKIETNTLTHLTPIGEIKRLNVQVHNGKILLRQWEQNEVQANIHIVATGGYADRLEERGEESYWKLEQNGSDIVFKQVSQMMLGVIIGSLTVNVELFVPKQQLNTRLETHNGRIEVNQFEGDLRVTTHNGVIRLEEIVGAVELESHNGDVNVEQLDGDLSIHVHNGRIEIERVKGRVKAVTHNGKIRAYECSRQLSLQTHNGAVQASTTQPLTESWDIQTGHGGIDVEVPRDSQIGFNIQTKLGKITGDAIPLQSNAINQHVKFSTGNGAPMIELESKMGRIEVNYIR